MIGLTYDFWACESSIAVTKPDLNLNSIADVKILLGHVRLTLLVVYLMTKSSNRLLAMKIGAWLLVLTAITKRQFRLVPGERTWC